MITADQIACHLVGDYILQSDWMARRKRSSLFVASIHGFAYTVPFTLLTQNWLALACILGTHAVVDRFGLARYVVWVKNWLCPFWRERPQPWAECEDTGYSPGRPAFMAVWLLIIADNTLHLVTNGIAISLFGR